MATAQSNGSAPETVLRQAFDAFERPLASASEAWVQSDGFMDALALTWKVQRRVARRVESGAATWLRLWGVPARGDVTRLVNQVAGLERQVRDLRREIERSRG